MLLFRFFPSLFFCRLTTIFLFISPLSFFSTSFFFLLLSFKPFSLSSLSLFQPLLSYPSFNPPPLSPSLSTVSLPLFQPSLSPSTLFLQNHAQKNNEIDKKKGECGGGKETTKSEKTREKTNRSLARLLLTSLLTSALQLSRLFESSSPRALRKGRQQAVERTQLLSISFYFCAQKKKKR